MGSGELGAGDTWCIDKTSSAELSESINSMFSWYQSSTICYAYLADVDSTTTMRRLASWDSDEQGSPSNVPSVPSHWYSRGWTLQELIAPLNVDFYNRHWARIGSKLGLRSEISDITGIGEADLVVFDPRRTSIAQKMSWSSTRNTTRVEDQAYCLLGIFGVYLSMLYSEGKNAFRRLQEELIRTSTDHSIFAWGIGSINLQTLLADAPGDFKSSGSIVGHFSTPGHDSDRPAAKKTYAITNVGLEIELAVFRDPYEKGGTALPHFRYRHKGLTVGLINCQSIAPRHQGAKIGLLLLADSSSTFRVYSPPIYVTTVDPTKVETKTIVISLEAPSTLTRLRPTPGANVLLFPKDPLRYRAQIFVPSELARHRARRVPYRGIECACVRNSTDLAGGPMESTEVEATTQGFCWFQPTKISKSIVIEFSIGGPWTMSLQLLLSAPPKVLLPSPPGSTPSTSTGVDSKQCPKMHGLTCHIKAAGKAGKRPGRAADGEIKTHGTYRRRPKGQWALEDGVWFEHALPNGQTLEATVVDMNVEDWFADVVIFGLK